MTSLADDSELVTRHSSLTTPATVDGRPSIVGIVGGVGPLAGLDLQHKIVAQTIARRDQDHLPVISVSWPGPIPDRTEYLLGHVAENPAYGVKSVGRVTAPARANLAQGIAALQKQGVEAIILGCTEMPIVFPEGEFTGLPLIDPTRVLARALIREVDPVRLVAH